MSGFWRDDYIAPGFSPAETAEARIDPDQENDNTRDDLNNWGGDWE